MSWLITGAPGTGDNLLYSQAGTPTIDLRLASTKSLVDNISGLNPFTFTRSGNATYFDSNGVIQTAGTDVARFDHDPTTNASLGLLIEVASTNLLTNSQTLATQSVTVAAVAHTLSFYGTGSVELSGAHTATVVGSGAFPARTTLTFTPTAGTLTLTVTGTVSYANLEAQSFATSWIPTTGASATRNADSAIISGSNFSRWFANNAPGCFYMQYNRSITINTAATNTSNWSVSSGPHPFSISSGSNTFSFGQGSPATNNRAFVRSSSSTQFDSASSTGLIANLRKLAFGFEVDNARISINGTNGSLDTALLLPVGVDRMTLSATGSTWYARFCHWGYRVPDATLQTITTL
jgi:hypothetical protein